MAAPAIVSVYPADEDSGIPIGAYPYVVFDRGVDLDTVQKSIVLYGADSDTTSGPDSAQWINPETGDNPFYLRSPGFKGVVDCEFVLTYVNPSTYAEVDPQPSISGEAAEVAGPYAMKVEIRPVRPLAPSTQYTLHVIGDTDDTGRGVGSRTVFDVVHSGSSTTGDMYVTGVFEGDDADSVVVEITTSGNIGTAKYRWYYTSAGVGTAVEGKVTSRRHRRLEDGLQVRFDGSGFVATDTYTFPIEPQQLLATSTTVVFTTGDGSYTEAPESPSTPATSSPPSSAIPGSTTSEDLYVVEMDPADGATHQAFGNRTITITFSASLDSDTITDSTVRVWAYPVSGVYSDTGQPVELSKKLTVSGTTLTIEV